MIADINDCRGCDNCYGCGAKHIKVLVCDSCGDPINDFIYYSTPDGDFCEECFFENNEDYTATLTLDNVLKLGDESPEVLNVNQFLSSVYSEEEIRDILISDFEKMPESKKREYIQAYAEEEEGPADWVRRMAEYGDDTAKEIVDCEVKND